MEIERIPGKLLFEHNCVIVPGLGGFVASPMGAMVHPGRHTFNPPFKAVLFNRNLNTNDGLLVSELAKQSNLSFNDAQVAVNNFVKVANQAINEKRKVVFPELGYLQADVEGNVLFTQDNTVNYLLEAYGLDEFQSLPVVKTDRGSQRTTVKVDRGPQPLTKARPKNSRRLVATGTTLALFLAVASFFVNFGLTNKNDFATLAFWQDRAPKSTAKWPEFKSDFEVRQYVQLDSLTLDSIAKAKALVEVPQIVEEPVKPVVAPTGTKQFYVVAGCFEDMDNARKYVSILKGEGVSSLIADKKNTKLYKVYLSSFSKMSEATNYVSTLDDSISSKVWIYIEK